MKILVLGFILIFTSVCQMLAEDWGNMHVSYIREIGNQLFLSDFQHGSEESIRDHDGRSAAGNHNLRSTKYSEDELLVGVLF